jgi:hypothetical protein
VVVVVVVVGEGGRWGDGEMGRQGGRMSMAVVVVVSG